MSGSEYLTFTHNVPSVAQCPVVEPVEAMVVGAIGSVITILTREGLPRYFKIDDPVGTASIHGAAGAWGAIAVAFFAHKDITEEMFIPETGWSSVILLRTII